MGVGLAVAAYAAARAPAPTSGVAQLLGSYEWIYPKGQSQPKWFGGFSALELSPDGQSMTVMTDRSRLLSAEIQRDGDRIIGIVPEPVTRLRSSKGVRLSKRVVDSEGLALAPNGGLYISFEGVTRVAYYPKPNAKAQVLPRPSGFKSFPVNKGPEALAIDSQGRLYTLPERSLDADGQIPVFRWNGARWSIPFAITPSNSFLPVGADFGPDGRFYLLERDFSLFGFRSRLRRWKVHGETLGAEQTLLQTGYGEHDNLEGVAIWRDAQNRLRATMVSDDNFLSLQKTELVEYALPD